MNKIINQRRIDYETDAATRQHLYDTVRILCSSKPNALKQLNRAKRNHRQIVFLLMHEGDSCFYCHRPLGVDITIEHLIPLDKGGPDNRTNIHLVHWGCNQAVRNLTVEEKMDIRFGSRAFDAPPPKEFGQS